MRKYNPPFSPPSLARILSHYMVTQVLLPIIIKASLYCHTPSSALSFSAFLTMTPSTNILPFHGVCPRFPKPSKLTCISGSSILIKPPILFPSSTVFIFPLTSLSPLRPFQLSTETLNYTRKWPQIVRPFIMNELARAIARRGAKTRESGG